MATAERMREVLDIVQTFPEHLPCVVLSAMGKVSCLCSCAGYSSQTLTCALCRPQTCCSRAARRHRPVRRVRWRPWNLCGVCAA